MAHLPRVGASVLRKGCVVLVEVRVFMAMEEKEVVVAIRDKQPSTPKRGTRYFTGKTYSTWLQHFDVVVQTFSLHPSRCTIYLLRYIVRRRLG
jgi:hypothetical protein